eukprot:6482685-Amphidinium_carterae.1
MDGFPTSRPDNKCRALHNNSPWCYDTNLQAHRRWICGHLCNVGGIQNQGVGVGGKCVMNVSDAKIVGLKSSLPMRRTEEVEEKRRMRRHE